MASKAIVLAPASPQNISKFYSSPKNRPNLVRLRETNVNLKTPDTLRTKFESPSFAGKFHDSFTKSKRVAKSPLLSVSPLAFFYNIPKLHFNENLVESSTLGNEVILSNEKEHEDSTTYLQEPSVDTPKRGSLLHHGVQSRNRWTVLGRGSFGIVVKAQYKGSKVAVKIFPKNRSSCSNTALLNEANALSFSHPNIVNIFKLICMEQCHGLVFMELHGKQNLQHLIQDPHFTLDTSLQLEYAHQIARAIEYCHKNKVLHLDIKPQNILVNISNQTCKLCDFGSSQKFGEEHGLTQPPNVNTVVYTDPQILKGDKPSTMSDVYSFGITLWQLLARVIPHNGNHLHVVIYQVVAKHMRPTTSPSLRETMSDYVALYEQCWQQDPHQRPCINDILRKLEQIIKSLHRKYEE